MPPGPETAIGIDAGGTRIRAARIGPDGAILAHLSEPTRPDREGFSAQLLRLVATLGDDSVVATGVGLPGRVDGARQRIVSAGYLDITDLDVAGLISGATGLPARIENDATMALLSEARHWPGDDPLCLVTVGTGIGGAVMQGGAPWYGGGFAGQFGHIPVASDGPPCKCGRRGCVETLSSGTALGRLLGEAGRPAGTTVETLIDGADAGDAGDAALLRVWAAPFERALQTLVATLDPRRILVGGGLGAAMVRALSTLPPGSPWFPLPVSAARLGDEAGVVGAGLAALAAARTR